MRSKLKLKLKRLVERGWLVEASAGLFACAGAWPRRWTAATEGGLGQVKGQGSSS